MGVGLVPGAGDALPERGMVGVVVALREAGHGRGEHKRGEREERDEDEEVP